MSNRGTVGRVICFVLGALSLIAALTVAITGAGMAGTGEMADGRVLIQLGLALGVAGGGWMVGALVWTQAARVAQGNKDGVAASPFPPQPPQAGQQPFPPQPQHPQQFQPQQFAPQPPQQ